MKKIFTLCSLITLTLCANNSFAQINENFDNGFAPLQADCWQFTSMMNASSPSGYVINGNGSAYSEPPVSSDSLRIMRTPFLLFGNTIDISFAEDGNYIMGRLQPGKTLQLGFIYQVCPFIITQRITGIK